MTGDGRLAGATSPPEVPLRKILALAAAAACAATTFVLTGPAAPAAAACSTPIQITSLTFNPARVSAGQSATLTLAAVNCTDQPQQTFLMVVARYVGPTGGIPAGCPAIDPLPPQAVPFAPHATFTTTQFERAFPSCTATSLHVTARFFDSTGADLTSQSADLPITPAPCAVTYRTTTERPGGFAAQVDVANIGTTAINGWTLVFGFLGDQQVSSARGATVYQAGATVTARNLRSDASIAPGATVTFGIRGTWHTSDATPFQFTLNGAACLTR
jgi:cellulose binding protein with CBM2 domain